MNSDMEEVLLEYEAELQRLESALRYSRHQHNIAIGSMRDLWSHQIDLDTYNLKRHKASRIKQRSITDYLLPQTKLGGTVA